MSRIRGRVVSGTSIKVTSRHICPFITRAGSKYRREYRVFVVSIMPKSQTMALAMTIYSISRGTPKLGCFQQNFSILRFKNFKKIHLPNIIPFFTGKVHTKASFFSFKTIRVVV